MRKHKMYREHGHMAAHSWEEAIRGKLQKLNQMTRCMELVEVRQP